MPKRFERKDYGSWDVWSNQSKYSLEELFRRRQQLAKAANRRILRLERVRSDISGRRFIDQPQFDNLVIHLELQNRKRFSEVKRPKGMSVRHLYNEISVMEKFLSMKSSTVGGSRSIEDERVDRFVQKGVPEEIARSYEFYQFLTSSTYDALTYSALDSEDIVEMFERGSDEGLNIEQIVEEFEAQLKDQKSGYLGMIERLERRGEMERKSVQERNRKR